MPNEHGQVIEEDFKAPMGQFRIMKELMSDGDLEIVADVRRQATAEKVIHFLEIEDEENVFTLYDDNGTLLI